MTGLSPVERRLAPRQTLDDGHCVTQVLVRPGRDVVLVNIALGGALVESPQQLRPESLIEVQLTTAERRLVVRGSVVRSSVWKLCSSGVWYRSAIRFEHHVAWFAHIGLCGYAVPAADSASSLERRASVSHAVF